MGQGRGLAPKGERGRVLGDAQAGGVLERGWVSETSSREGEGAGGPQGWGGRPRGSVEIWGAPRGVWPNSSSACPLPSEVSVPHHKNWGNGEPMN